MSLVDAGVLSLLAILAFAQLAGAARGSRGQMQALVFLLFAVYAAVTALFVMGLVFRGEGTPWPFIAATLVVNAGLAGGVIVRRRRRSQPGVN